MNPVGNVSRAAIHALDSVVKSALLFVVCATKTSWRSSFFMVTKKKMTPGKDFINVFDVCFDLMLIISLSIDSSI